MGKEARHILVVLSLLILVVCSSEFVSSAPGWNESAYNITYELTEDVPYYHNFTVNVTNPISNMVFAVDTVGQVLLWDGVETDYSEVSSWIYFLNSTTGMFLINATTNNQTGNFIIPIKVSDGGQVGSTAGFSFNVTTINDAPIINNLTNETMNRSSEFYRFYNITDEENNFN
ncbi:MAG: hypothetical protein KC506_03845, partial [Nanoarchaeota archaeon]|nr:hypothetical protein [Nanoarchaeota archaeon]